MIKTNLPVLILRGVVLLPNNDIRIEFDNDISKNIIDVSELFHDNNILVVSPEDPLEEAPKLEELPKIGVISKVSHKIVLPNGKVRVIVTGIARAQIHEYLNLNHNSEILETIASKITIDINKLEEEMLIKKLYREMEIYTKTIPYMSNSILSQISNITDLSKLTDVIVGSLSLSLDRMHLYLNTVDVKERSEMILEDLYQEEEMYKVEKELDTKVKKSIDSTQKEFLLREKIKAIKEELGEASSKEIEIDDLKYQIDTLEAPVKIKEKLTSEFKKYKDIPSVSPEIGIVRNYIDWLLDLPWNKYTIDNEDLKSVKDILDESHYGLDKVKTRIIEFLAVKKMVGYINGPIICLVGPPGVGKTSLASSVARAMKRNFVKISLGGVDDTAEIMGHRRTYIGSSPGRIISSLKKAKSMNPVFLIDEIDKMTKDIKGDPASSLLEVLDPEQNKYFTDNYVEEEVDLSGVFFIATANYIDDIPEALKDRLEIINLSGYTEYEKLDIAKKHLIPKICKNNGLKEMIDISDNLILDIIRGYTKEAGVRELERLIETIVRKVVTLIVMEEAKINNKIESKDIIKFLGKPKYNYKHNTKGRIGVVNGLAYTQYGGDVLSIEVNFYEGHGNLTLTGSLGDVMKESAYIALSYIKANYKHYNIDYKKLTENDIHIHVPEGAIPKDGPSAGIALTTALISAFTNQKINDNLAMTGEITLQGSVLPIGGLKEKSIGAYRNHINKILIPYDNLKDLEEVPKEIKDNITYIPIKDYKEVNKYTFSGV